MQTDRTLALLACPDCRGKLEQVVGVTTEAFACDVCRLVFPVEDGVNILLPSRARNPALEYPLVEALGRSLPAEVRALWAGHVAETLALLERCGDERTWEWQDEEYWDRVYTDRAANNVTKNWNDRLWEREFLVHRVLRERGRLADRTVLDVGCGEGHNFVQLIAPHCDAGTLYVACDISLAALKLNRSRNPHANALYLLCTADSLPLQPGTVDLLCYFGILHHTERKSRTLVQDSDLLKDGALVVLHEVLDRPTVTELLRLPRGDGSAHEERVSREELFATIRSRPCLRILAVRERHTAVYSAALRLGGGLMTTRRWVFDTVSALDRLVMVMFRSFIPLCRPAAILMVLQRRPATP